MAWPKVNHAERLGYRSLVAIGIDRSTTCHAADDICLCAGSTTAFGSPWLNFRSFFERAHADFPVV